MDEQKSNASPLAYLAAGAAVGAVVGAGLTLFFAPDEETRRRLKGWVSKEADALKEQKRRLGAAYEAGRDAYVDVENRKIPA